MNLQERIANVKKFGNDKLIVEFDNGFGVAYERTSQKSHPVVYGVLHQSKLLSYHPLCGWHMKLDDGNAKRGMCGSVSNFTPEACESFVTYQQQRQTKLGELEQELADLYEEITTPLNIQEKKDRPWGLLVSSAVVTLTYPVSVPLGLAYLECQWKKYVREFQKVHGEGRLPHTEAMPPGLLLIASPLVFAHALYETILSDRQGERFYKVGNRKALITEKNSVAEASEILAAVEFASLDKKFCTWTEWFLGLGHPKDGTPARSRSYPTLFFADGKELHQGGYAFERHIDGEYGPNKRYTKAQWFLSVKQDVKQRLDSLIKQQHDLLPKEKEFEEEIHQSVGEHLTLLKSIGFLEKSK